MLPELLRKEKWDDDVCDRRNHTQRQGGGGQRCASGRGDVPQDADRRGAFFHELFQAYGGGYAGYPDRHHAGGPAGQVRGEGGARVFLHPAPGRALPGQCLQAEGHRGAGGAPDRGGDSPAGGDGHTGAHGGAVPEGERPGAGGRFFRQRQVHHAGIHHQPDQ